MINKLKNEITEGNLAKSQIPQREGGAKGEAPSYGHYAFPPNKKLLKTTGSEVRPRYQAWISSGRAFQNGPAPDIIGKSKKMVAGIGKGLRKVGNVAKNIESWRSGEISAGTLKESDDSRASRWILKGYIDAALWSSSGTTPDGEEIESLDSKYDERDISSESIRKAKKDIAEFESKAGSLLYQLDPEKIGHDLWLTRNRHGAGFWDGDYDKEVGEKLTKIAHQLGEVTAIIGDDGEIYFE